MEGFICFIGKIKLKMDYFLKQYQNVDDKIMNKIINAFIPVTTEFSYSHRLNTYSGTILFPYTVS